MGAAVFRKTISNTDSRTLIDVLAAHSGLSKTRVKRAMNLGAAWLQRAGAPMRRVRRASTQIEPGDVAVLYYDERILDLIPPAAHCVRDLKRYSIWHKPPGMMTQGSRFGDHCALIRQVELHFRRARPALAVHRIDREADGLVLVAHERKAAALLSELLRNGSIEKQYLVWVRGNLFQQRDQGLIDLSLDGRPASTRYTVLEYDAAADQSRVQVQILTGRRHQIRRHFDMIGHPVMGDPRYGTGNKNRDGLRLSAYALAFDCPLGNGRIAVEIDPRMKRP